MESTEAMNYTNLSVLQAASSKLLLAFGKVLPGVLLWGLSSMSEPN
jgi:hypothetical protein